MVTSSTKNHPNLKQRQLEEFERSISTDSQFAKERPHFVATPRLVRQAPGAQIPLISHIMWDQHTKESYNIPDGYYVTTAGVCWPTPLDGEGLVGIAIAAALNLSTQEVWILSERKFITVERTDDYPADAPRPLQHCLHACRKFYRVGMFSHNQSEGILNRFRPAIRRAFPDRHTTPYFVKQEWNDFHTAMQAMYEYVALQRFKFYESRLWSEMQGYEADPEGTYPALHAACVCLLGLDRKINNEYNIKNILQKIEAFG